jgi:hypothetical protein
MRRRLASLLILCTTVALGFGLSWNAMGLHDALQWQAKEMVAKLEAIPLKPTDRLTWVKGRPDARLSYYLNHDVEPLFTSLELAPRREGRRYVQTDILVEGGERILERLENDKGEYFIIDVDYWALLQEHFKPDAREIFRVEGPDANDVDDDWVVITRTDHAAAMQKDRSAEPTTQPGTQP